MSCIQQVAYKRLGITEKLIDLTKWDSDIAKFNRQRLQDQVNAEIDNIKEFGISEWEYNYFKKPQELEGLVRYSEDPNREAMELIGQRFREPEVALKLELINMQKQDILKKEQYNRLVTMQNQALRQQKIEQQRQAEEKQRVELIKTRAESMEQKYLKAQAHQQMSLEAMQRQQDNDMKRRNQLEQQKKIEYDRNLLEKQNLYSRKLQQNKQLMDRTQTQYLTSMQCIKDYEDQIYAKHKSNLEELEKQMAQKGQDRKRGILEHQIQKEKRFLKCYQQRVDDFQKRQQIYEISSAKQGKMQQEYQKEKSQLFNTQFKTTREKYYSMQAFDYENKDKQWQEQQRIHEAARQNTEQLKLQEILRAKQYNDYKSQLAQSKQEQLKAQLEYCSQIQDMRLHDRFERVDEFLSFKYNARNRNQQICINDQYLTPQRLQSVCSTQGRRPATNPPNAASQRVSKPVIQLDIQEYEQILKDFTQKEQDTRQRLLEAPLQEKIALISQLTRERDELTQMSRQINGQLLRRMAK